MLIKIKKAGAVSWETINDHKDQLNAILLSLVIIFLVFPIKNVIDSPISYILGNFSGLTSYSIYVADIIILTFIGFNFNKKVVISPLFLLVAFSLVLSGIINTQENFGFYIYSSLRLLVLIMFLLHVFFAFADYKNKILFIYIFYFSVFFQSLIAFGQFFMQKSLNLWFFDESKFNGYMYDVAKIVSDETLWVRAYGTQLHPNILGGIAVLAIICGIYLLINYQKYTKLLFFHVVIIIGLALTFSRSALIAIFISIIYIFFFGLYKRIIMKPALKMIVLSTFIIFLFLALFKPILLSRIDLLDDNSVNERVRLVTLNKEDNSYSYIMGVGYNQSLIHMKQRFPFIPSWEIQPMHNIYLLTIRELGIFGLFIIVIFLNVLFKSIKNTVNIKHLFLSGAIIAIFIIGLFDHYWYTIWTTQVLFGLVITFLVISYKNKPKTIYDT